jgi:hypothetical protein
VLHKVRPQAFMGAHVCSIEAAVQLRELVEQPRDVLPQHPSGRLLYFS